MEYTDLASFPVTGETGKIYVDKATNKTYRWSGSAYVVISETLALGETSATAYRGDKGKTAYDHSQLSSGNPHSVSKSDVGLGNADNTSDEDKPISTAQQGALDLKVNIADLDVVYSTDIDRIGYFTYKENNVVSTTISQLAVDILTCVASYQRPLMVGVRNGYDGGKQLTISDAPILSSSPLVNLNTTFDGYGIVYGLDRVEFYLHPYAIQSVAAYKTAVFYGIYKPSDGVNPAEFSGWKQITYKEYVDTIESEKEDVANKTTTWQETPDDTHYPSEKLIKDSLDVVVEETRDVGTTEISFENGKVVAITSDNCTTSLLYDANGNIQKITETYADGKSYETTYTKDVEGRIKTMTKAEV